MGSESESAPTLPLRSYPGQVLPWSLEADRLLPARPRQSVLDPGSVRAGLVRAMAASLDALPTASKQLLLVLPDKTRRAAASHLAVDALLDLLQSRGDMRLVVLFGLGRHPPMSHQAIERLLGEERLLRLQQARVEIFQQTTQQPLPARALVVPQLQDLAAPPLRLTLPEQLWQSDLVLVAGTTELHPYEGRSGSGGLHKMLVVGLGNRAVIRQTHSLDVLLDPATGRDDAANPFVRLLDHYADAISAALLAAPDARLASPPWGFSVLCADPACDDLHGVWLGQRDADRAVLARQLVAARTCRLSRPLNLVVVDAERNKATDILAGARSLHGLCAADRPGHRLLCSSAPLRTALLFNPCHEQRNAGGIGNSGTKLHLDALGVCVREQVPLLQRGLERASTAAERRNCWRRARARCLRRWRRHLQWFSAEEQHLRQLLTLLDQLTGSVTPLQVSASSSAVDRLLRHTTVMPALPPRRWQQMANLWAAGRCSSLREQVQHWLALDDLQGLGDGGQRALRLLLILERFDRLVIATDNGVVQAYLEELSPDLSCLMDAEYFDGVSASLPFRHDLLGLSSIDLRQCSPGQALDCCLVGHRQLLGPAIATVPALLQEPVLLQAP